MLAIKQLLKGDLVESDAWAETMAYDLELVQWHIRIAGLVDGPALGEPPRSERGGYHGQ